MSNGAKTKETRSCSVSVTVPSVESLERGGGDRERFPHSEIRILEQPRCEAESGSGRRRKSPGELVNLRCVAVSRHALSFEWMRQGFTTGAAKGARDRGGIPYTEVKMLGEGMDLKVRSEDRPSACTADCGVCSQQQNTAVCSQYSI